MGQLDQAHPDPYSQAMKQIVEALRKALYGGMGGSMSEGEFETLRLIEETVKLRDPAAAEMIVRPL